MGLASGLRQGELISLPWAAIDVCGRRIILQKHWVGLPAQAAELMAEEHAKHPDSPEASLDASTGQPYSSEVMLIHPGTLKPYSPEMIRLLHKRVLDSGPG